MIEIRSSHPEAFHRQHLERFGVHSQREPRRLHRQGRPGHDDRLFARLAKRIRVNEVRPGIIATDMTARVKDQYDRRIADGLTPIRRWGAGGRGTGGTRLAGPTSISPPPWPSTSMAGSICTGCKTPDQGLMTKTIRAIRKLGPEPSDPFHRRSVRVGPDVLIRWRPRASAAPTSTSIAGTSGASTIKPPLTLGHEFAGTVVELGDAVENVRVGDFVSAESHITCGMCFQCRTGQAHMCPHTKILGVDRDGAFAEFVSVPSSVIWRNDRTKMPPEIATLQEPFGNAVFATLAHEMPGQSVAVFGCGPIGLFAIAIARASGAAKSLRATSARTASSSQRRWARASSTTPGRRTLAPRMVPRTQRGSGSTSLGCRFTGEHSERLSRRQERQARFALQHRRAVELDVAENIIFKNLTVLGLNARKIFETWYRAMAPESGVVDLHPLITLETTLEDYEEAFTRLATGKACKIILRPQKEPFEVPRPAEDEAEAETSKRLREMNIRGKIIHR